MLGVDSSVFLIFTTRVDPNKWVNSGEIDPFRKISCGIGIRFFNLDKRVRTGEFQRLKKRQESGNTIHTLVKAPHCILPRLILAVKVLVNKSLLIEKLRKH